MNIRERAIHRTLNPLLATLPPKFSAFRDHQVYAIREALKAYEDGAKVVVIDAPTGSGKTLIGETIRLMLGARGLYVCSSKSLQAQFAGDFDYSRVLMGRGNYATQLYPRDFHPGTWRGHTSCDDCTWERDRPVCFYCKEKSLCPYEVAKQDALRAPLAVLNTSYFLAEANSAGRVSGRGFVVLDEADTLESQLMGYVEVSVAERRMGKYGWVAPKVTVESDWLRWISEAIPDIQGRAGLLNPSDKWESKELKYLERLGQNLVRIKTGMEEEGSEYRGRWVYTGNKDHVGFKPTHTDLFGREMVWGHADKFLLMSATIISAEELLVGQLGYEGAWKGISLDSTFPVTNRLVIFRPIADMSHANEGKDDGKLIAAIRAICTTHEGDRVLIHSVSYTLTSRIQRTLAALFPRRTVLSYTQSADRESVLTEYRSTPGAILVAPSLDRGIDLAEDDCRVQIIAKVPFPNLGDKQVSARFHSGREGKTWYTVNTIRTIVQMTGRAVRSESDYARTYILDTQFRDRLWSNAKQLFPKWWRDSVVWERN